MIDKRCWRRRTGDFIPNGDGKVPFQAVSLKDLSSSNDHHMGHSLGGHLTTGVPGGCHTLHATSGGVIGTVDLETVNSSPGNSSSCLRASNYSRPYDIFPVNVAIDATLRRTGTSIGVSGVTGHEHQSFQVSSLFSTLHVPCFFLLLKPIIERGRRRKGEGEKRKTKPRKWPENQFASVLWLLQRFFLLCQLLL